MELLKANLFLTSTSIVVDSNTASAEFIMDPDTSFQWVSSGFNNDLTTASMTINFDETVTVSRIALVGMNLKAFDMFYNGATANTFSITSTGDTTTSQYSSNSETSKFIQVTPVQCTSVTIDMKSTIVADAEKAIGYLVVSEEHVDFPRIPAAKDYKPQRFGKEIVHTLSDGSVRIQTVATKHSADVKLEYISESFRNSLKTIFDLHEGMIFVPFGTTTGWDAVIFPCVWPSPFDFYRYSDNAPNAGFGGTIRLKETSPA